ncbi:MAG: ComEA family DNA-binding protein [Ruminococcaceae bacterium]|nr:ComEA family DNA-binding protein [Oscillospiraceae bacterium]
MKKDYITKILFFTIAFSLLVFVGWLFSAHDSTDAVKITNIEYTSDDKIIVELGGEVKNAGSYSVERGTRLHDVIYMAGGFSKKADSASVDLDRILADSCTIVVGKAGDASENFVESEAIRTDGKCNINTASISELEALDGIGETIAQRIINYREINGKFTTLEDLKKVKGIGQKKFELIRDFITVGGN